MTQINFNNPNVGGYGTSTPDVTETKGKEKTQEGKMERGEGVKEENCCAG